MMSHDRENGYEKHKILNDTIEMIEETTAEWEMPLSGSIGQETYLGADLAFSSIDLVKLAATIQQRYEKVSLPFQDLIIDGDQVKLDIQVSDLVDFLHKHLNQHR